MSAVRHAEETVVLRASPEAGFAWLDDHGRLSGHMERRSWRMGGGEMHVTLDQRQGRGVGAVISLRASVLGIPLHVEEVVTRYDPPAGKTWETTGVPRLIVIGPYRMGFELTPRGASSLLKTFIDYQQARRWLRPLARWYASWCVRSMARDAAAHFTKEAS